MEYRDTHTIDDDTKNNMTFLANILTALLWSSKTKKNEWNTLKALYFLCSQFCVLLATLYIENLYIFYWLVMQQTSSNKSDKKVNTNKKQNMKSLAEQYYAL